MKILYLGYFSKLNIDERFCSLAANNVCSYVKTTLCKKYDGDVVIINLAQGKKHFSFCKSNKSTNGNVTIIDAPRYGSGRLLSRFSNLMLRKWVRKFIKRNLEDNDQILIYHSLNTLKLERYIARKYNSVLQVEEIYCDVVAKSRKTKRIELESINSFSKHLFVSKSLMNDSRIKSLNSTIFYGSYSLPEVPNVNRLNKSIVYAGTFEKNKGVDFACDLMEILPDYTLYVYGHGSASRKEELLSKYGKKKNIVFCDQLRDEDLSQKLFQYQYGISPLDPNSAFNSTTFPSKILTYLKSGLMVVSSRFNSVIDSPFNEYVIMADYNFESYKKAIVEHTACVFDSRNFIKSLDDKFGHELIDLIKL